MWLTISCTVVLAGASLSAEESPAGEAPNNAADSAHAINSGASEAQALETEVTARTRYTDVMIATADEQPVEPTSPTVPNPDVEQQSPPAAPLPAAETTIDLNAPELYEPPLPVAGNGADDGPIVSINGSPQSPTPRKVHFAVRLNLREVYDDNVNISHTDREEDFFTVIEPAISIGLGDIEERQANYVRLDYAPSASIFVKHSDINAIQHVIRLEGQYRFSRLTLTVSQDVQLLDGADLNTVTTAGTEINRVNLDVSARTALNIYTTHLNASYDLSGKTFVTGALTYAVNDYEQLISSEYGSGSLYINYNYSPKLVVGAGAVAGYNTVDSAGRDQVFEQINGRISYQATGKVSLNATAGIELRQFEGTDSRGTYVSPVFEIGGTYQPFEGTTLSLTANRRTLNSAVFNGQDYSTTAIVFGARQRLVQRVFVGLSAGYEHSDYFSTIQSLTATRRDDYFFIQPSADVSITRFLSVGLYCLHRENDSTTPRFSFYDNQLGLRASFAF